MSPNYLVVRRRTRNIVRLLTLTKLGVATTEGLRFIMKVLVISSTVGVPTFSAEGEEFRGRNR